MLSCPFNYIKSGMQNSYNWLLAIPIPIQLEKWVSYLDLQPIGLQSYRHIRFTDDRFAKALDKIYQADRASLMTKIVVTAIDSFDIELKQIHNDSTTVKATGQYSKKTTSTGFALKNGISKDHRPDLKQLLFTLTVSADGAVPIHHKTYSGNRTDDTTHIETWKMLCQLKNEPDFLYVADCKVCTDKQLSFITGNGGKVITVIPNNWKEVQDFKEELRYRKKSKKEIYRKRNSGGQIDYYYALKGDYFTQVRNYRIHWIFSTKKQASDRCFREHQIEKAEKELKELKPKLNRRKLKTKEDIQAASDKVLINYRVEKFISLAIEERKEFYKVQESKGRPGPNTRYRVVENTIYVLRWSRNKKAIRKEENVDGVFPILSTDEDLSARDALLAYKFQPRLEKRFTQFKSIHNAAPLLFKKPERIEANMFVFFIALLVQALIERQIRKKMKEHELSGLEIYPENRLATHPTTTKVFEIFNPISTYAVMEKGKIIDRYQDELDPVQRKILDFLEIDVRKYWCSTTIKLAGDDNQVGGF